MMQGQSADILKEGDKISIDGAGYRLDGCRIEQWRYSRYRRVDATTQDDDRALRRQG
jgi:hypothetical protein